MLVKICCIQSPEEARLAAAAGATHIGLVGAMPSGPGPIADEAIRDIAAQAPVSVVPVLLTSEVTADAIAAHVRRTGVPAVQIVRHIAPTVRQEVRARLPGVTVLQVVHVEGAASVDYALEAADAGADMLLLDSGRPGAPTPQLGGTGRTHDWSLSAAVVRASSAPVFLAGGLNAGNVRDAVAAVGPAGVDLCSGVRDARGRLDESRLTSFMAALHRGAGAGPADRMGE